MTADRSRRVGLKIPGTVAGPFRTREEAQRHADFLNGEHEKQKRADREGAAVRREVMGPTYELTASEQTHEGDPVQLAPGGAGALPTSGALHPYPSHP
jgi:hypothetical protein